MEVENIVLHANEISFGASCFNISTGIFRYRSHDIELTKREAEVLYELLLQLNQLCTRDKVLTKYWGSTDRYKRRSMDVIIRRIRKVLAKDASIKLVNIYSKGYILKELSSIKESEL